jgi:chromate transporter
VPDLSLLQLVLRFLRFGFLAWGGPVAQIAMLRRELVDDEAWIPSDRFNRTLAVYQALPGPEAQELTIYFGTLARGRVGGFLAGVCFLLPGFALMLALSWFYVEVGIESPLFAAAFAGCQAAVVALIVRGVHRIGERALNDRYLVMIAASALIAGLARLHFALPLVAGGVSYLFIARGYRAAGFLVLAGLLSLMVASFIATSPIRPGAPEERSTGGRERSTPEQLLASGLKAGALTFGGAYTAIPFVEQDATGEEGWMTRDQFLDGIALSGVIPAPLVIFATFVGYLGGGFVGAGAITVGIFLPAFVITLAGHRYLEAAVSNPRLHAVLDGVAAGVVGLVGATLVHLAPAALGSLPAVAIFSVALAILYAWRASVGVAVVVAAAGVAGFLLLR